MSIYDQDEYNLPQPSGEAKDAMRIDPVVIQYDAQNVYDSIVRAAATSIIEKAGRDIRSAVSESVSAQISTRVGELIDATMAAGIQPHNAYGEPAGEPTTLKAMIGKAGEKYMSEKVDKDGHATTYNPTRTRLEYLVAKAVEQHIDYRLKSEIEKAVKAATEAAQMKVGEVVGSIIVKLGK